MPRNYLRVLDTTFGDTTLNAQQAAAIGAAFGNGAAQFGVGNTIGDDGNLFVSAVNPGVSPASTANDNVLAVFTIPANSFDIANRGLNIMACGSMPNNTNVKRVKIIIAPTTAVVGSAVVGGTAVADTGSVTGSATTSGGFEVAANIFKYGAAGSNTQIAIHESSQVGNAIQQLLAPSFLTITENAPIVVAITGNATTATTDIVLNLTQAFAMN